MSSLRINERLQTIFDKINEKYGGKVVPQIGFCIGAYDITEIGDGKLPPGDGASHFDVHVTLLVWRPIDGEVIEGQICDCTPRGIRVSLQFFDDIWVEPKHMFQGCKFFPARGDNTAYWKFVQDGQDMDDEDEGFFFDNGIKIRVKFESCDYFTKQQTNLSGEPITVKKETVRATKAKKVKFEEDETGMGAEKGLEAVPQTRKRSYSTEDVNVKTTPVVKDEPKSEDTPPMLVKCSCNQSGLGNPNWWLSSKE